MARLLKEIAWGEPLLPLPDDPSWAAEVKRTAGRVVPAYLYPARSRWVREASMAIPMFEPHVASQKLVLLAVLVTSQENSCRYCYGAARAYLKMMGLGEAAIDRVERDIHLAGTDDAERDVLTFCRNLSRSKPRPVRAELDALVARGYPRLAMIEVAFAVASACFSNRVSTFLALPVEQDLENFNPGPMSRIGMWLHSLTKRKHPKPVSRSPAEPRNGPFADIVDLVDGTEGAQLLENALGGALSSPALPVRTKAWVFAVVARALSCRLCEEGSARVLGDHGVSAEARERILGSLTGPELDATEAVVLPWVRETAHYQTEVMQRRTRELRDRVGDDVVLEVIGLAALANACSRLSMLAQ